MKTQDQTKIENAKNMAARASKRLCGTLMVLFVVFLLVVGTVIVGTLGNEGLLSGVTVLAALRIMSGLTLAAIGVALLLVIIRLLSDSSSGQFPFSLVQARRLFAIGVLLLVLASLEALGVACSAVFGSSIAVTRGLLQGVPITAIHSEVLYIVAAIVSFYLSYMFKYGTFLQWLYNETV